MATPSGLRQRHSVVETAPSPSLSSVSFDVITTAKQPIEAGKGLTLIPSLFRLLVGAASFAAVGVLLVFRGAELEKEGIAKAKSSLALYTDDQRVCARKASLDERDTPFLTFPTASAARDGGNEIAHCGGCGQCSSMPDMSIMAQTTQTLTDGTTKCSTKGYVMSLFLWRGIDVYRRISSECMRESVGFTPPCQQCWVDAMACNIQNCVNNCVKSVHILHEPKNYEDGSLNTCLDCDEKICGPGFLECSGANRRRQGIQSDIARDDAKEICRSVDIDWGEKS